jgi:hypothetical protein
MTVTSSSITDNRAAALLRLAAYLSRPQKFMAVAEARAEMRRTLEMAEKGSVALYSRRAGGGGRVLYYARRHAPRAHAALGLGDGDELHLRAGACACGR